MTYEENQALVETFQMTRNRWIVVANALAHLIVDRFPRSAYLARWFTVYANSTFENAAGLARFWLNNRPDQHLQVEISEADMWKGTPASDAGGNGEGAM